MKHSSKQQQKKKQKHFNTLRDLSLKNTITSTTLLLFPNQLLAKDKLTEIISENKVTRIIFIEHPLYFGYTATSKSISQTTAKKYNYNKLKIIYHIAANLYYYQEILQQLDKTISTEYIELFDFNGFNKLNNQLKITSTYQKPVIYIDTLNTELNQEIQRVYKQHIELDSPVLLTSKSDLELYAKKHKGKQQSHSAFYKWQKQRLKILTDEKKTYDIQQRIPQGELKEIPQVSSINQEDKHYLQLALNKFNNSRDYLSTFGENSGPVIEDITVEENFLFPVSHKGASEYLQYFITKKFSSFTKYQDSIVPGYERNKTQLYHAGISPMMNIGLLLAEDILQIARKAMESSKGKIDIAAYESFIRQIIGWREYQYYIYCFHRERLEGSNYFNNNRKLTAVWYTGSTGIVAVDDAIKVAFRYGYLHHILRLMVVCNFMNLCMIEPTEVFRWFMEFSLDSYEWVMYCNVYSMGIWSDGGVAMRKPYIASDAYIVKMSNYMQVSKAEKPSVKEWMRVWYALYYNFINVKSEMIKRTYYAGMIKNWQNKSTQEQKELTQLANDFFDEGYKIKDNNLIKSNVQLMNGGSGMQIGWYTEEELKNFITENAMRINEFKGINKLDSIEAVKSAVSKKMSEGDRLIDIIFTADDMDFKDIKNIKIWNHGILDNKAVMLESITAGVNGVHYYIIINKNTELNLAASFIRD